MQTILFFVCTLMVLSCANRTENSNTVTDSATTTAIPANPPLNDEEMRFLTGCVENARTRYSEAESFTLCKCMLTQVQKKFPTADSATILQHLSDTAEVAQMIRNCR